MSNFLYEGVTGSREKLVKNPQTPQSDTHVDIRIRAYRECDRWVLGVRQRCLAFNWCSYSFIHSLFISYHHHRMAQQRKQEKDYTAEVTALQSEVEGLAKVSC